MRAVEFLEKNMDRALILLIEKGKQELRAQGHRSSGELERSFAREVEVKLTGEAVGGIYAKEYAIYLDKGVKAARVRYNPKVLLPWIDRIKPGLTLKEKESFAWAIRKKHDKEGIPTKGSFAYSNNGRRKSWIEYGYDNNLEEFDTILDLAGFFQLLVDETLTEVLGG